MPFDTDQLDLLSSQIVVIADLLLLIAVQEDAVPKEQKRFDTDKLNIIGNWLTVLGDSIAAIVTQKETAQ
jgi:hypothetical protein